MIDQPTTTVPGADAVPPPPAEAPAAPSKRARRKSLLQELLETVLLTLILFGIARFSLQNFMVEGTSMVPTLQDGEYILVDKVSYLFHAGHLPSRGDIIVFQSPPSARQDGKDFIKRVIGLPGDRIAIRPVTDSHHITINHVFVNGKMLSEPYISAPPPDTQLPGCIATSGCSYTVPRHDIFVMGDNRPGSYDSRDWGPLPVSDVIGRALIAYWPLKDFAILHGQYSYASR